VVSGQEIRFPASWKKSTIESISNAGISQSSVLIKELQPGFRFNLNSSVGRSGNLARQGWNIEAKARFQRPNVGQGYPTYDPAGLQANSDSPIG
jgi:hypothetical protein